MRRILTRFRRRDPVADSGNVVELDDVGKVFPGAGDLVVLKSVNLKLGRGELVAITGPSGSGKSTLMDIVGTLSRPTTGTVCINGRLTGSMSGRDLALLRAQTIGFVFQQFNLLATLSAEENVSQALIYQGVRSNERKRRSREALGSVGLAHRFDHRPGEMSGGERQRVAIARALVTNPSLILADEPTGSLDQQTGSEILALLRQVNAAGASVAIVTHDEQLAASLPRRIRVLDGRIVGDEGPNPTPPLLPQLAGV